eukprot:662669-Pyramimonas_sp.AAC.1
MHYIQCHINVRALESSPHVKDASEHCCRPNANACISGEEEDEEEEEEEEVRRRRRMRRRRRRWLVAQRAARLPPSQQALAGDLPGAHRPPRTSPLVHPLIFRDLKRSTTLQGMNSK